MVKQRIALGAITGVILAAWTSHATAQLCDDRFPMSCGFSAPPSQTRPAPFGPGPIAPRIEAQPEPLVPAAPGRPGAFGRSIDPAVLGQYASLYARLGGEPFPVPAVDLTQIELAVPAPHRRLLDERAPGTIVIDPQSRFLYLVQGGGAAIRYGVGVGREGFAWSGTADDPREAGMARLVSAQGDDPAPTRAARAAHQSAERHRHGGRAAQPARLARPLSLAGQPRHALPHSRHRRAMDNRQAACHPAASG